MTYQPVLPLSGFAGWSFLKRTMEDQQAAMKAAASTTKDAAYFREKIGTIDSAEDLVADRRLLNVALTAYGLQDDINYKAFITEILDEGTLAEDALANRLSDRRYFELSKAFGFGDFDTPRSQISDFADRTLELFYRQTFETAVGAQNNSYRLALNAEHALADIAGGSGSETTKWFSILGNAPLREVMQTALGLPTSFAAIDLDQQLTVVKDRSERLFGNSDPSQFANPGNVEKLVRTYLVRSEVAQSSGPQSAASVALQILSS